MRKFLYLRPSAGSIPLNRRFGELLEEYFPEYAMDVVDVFKLVSSDRRVLFVNVLHTIRLYGWEIVIGRKSARLCYRRTPYIFEEHTGILHLMDPTTGDIFDAGDASQSPSGGP